MFCRCYLPHSQPSFAGRADPVSGFLRLALRTARPVRLQDCYRLGHHLQHSSALLYPTQPSPLSSPKSATTPIAPLTPPVPHRPPPARQQHPLQRKNSGEKRQHQKLHSSIRARKDTRRSKAITARPVTTSQRLLRFRRRSKEGKIGRLSRHYYPTSGPRMTGVQRLGCCWRSASSSAGRCVRTPSTFGSRAHMRLLRPTAPQRSSPLLLQGHH